MINLQRHRPEHQIIKMISEKAAAAYDLKVFKITVIALNSNLHKVSIFACLQKRRNKHMSMCFSFLYSYNVKVQQSNETVTII